MSHTRSRLLADLAPASTLTGHVSMALGSLARLPTIWVGVLTDPAVAIADGAECISDVAVLADQPGLFGSVAPDSTVWRLLDRLDENTLAGVASARAGRVKTLCKGVNSTMGRRVGSERTRHGRCSAGVGD